MHPSTSPWKPFRALVADLLPSEQRTTGFAVQSFFIGIGAVIASAFPYLLTNMLGVANTAPAGEIPPSVVFSFYAGAIAFIGAVGWTVFRTKEYPPADMQEFEKRRAEHKGFLAGAREIFSALREMPATMVQLAVVQFFSWFALFCMWIYTTGAVTQHIFHASDPTTAAYNEGADWVGVLFAVYNGCAALAAFAIPGWRATPAAECAHDQPCLRSAGLLSMTIITSPTLLLLSMVGVGLHGRVSSSMPTPFWPGPFLGTDGCVYGDLLTLS
jgi:maltose/moltooligosaccharide transporter